MNAPQLIALHVLSIETVPASALLHLSDFGREISLAGFAWLYRSAKDSAWTLIDTGTEDLEPLNAGRPPERQWQSHSLQKSLDQHGVAISDIKDVVLTHLHADHCGSVGLFPDARWHVPAIEWDFVNNPTNDTLAPEPLFPRNAIEQMRSHGVQPLHEGDQPVDGLRMKHLGGHSIGSMAVEICNKAGKAVLALAGDVMPLYEKLTRQIAPATLWHWGECKQALEYLSSLNVPVLPNHDPELLQRYPDGVILHG